MGTPKVGFSSRLYTVLNTVLEVYMQPNSAYIGRLRSERVLKLPYLAHIISVITWAGNSDLDMKRHKDYDRIPIC